MHAARNTQSRRQCLINEQADLLSTFLLSKFIFFHGKSFSTVTHWGRMLRKRVCLDFTGPASPTSGPPQGLPPPRGDRQQAHVVGFERGHPVPPSTASSRFLCGPGLSDKVGKIKRERKRDFKRLAWKYKFRVNLQSQNSSCLPGRRPPGRREVMLGQ